MAKILRLHHIDKHYGPLEIFRDFSVDFIKHRINCIFGPSGCGKTTLLNIIGGLTLPDAGSREDFQELGISYVFQEPRLLPWKTVEENIAFVLKEDMEDASIRNILKEQLNNMQLTEFAHYYPAQLSGGMKQRVSLARAFSFRSDVILMDEPFKAVDRKLKNNLIDQFNTLWKEDKRTVIYVTHEIDEAVKAGQNIILLSKPPVRIIGEFVVPVGEQKIKLMREEILQLMDEEEEI